MNKPAVLSAAWMWALLAVLTAAATYFFLPADCPEPARRTAAVFVLAAFFWGMEIIPLFATSILVVVLLIFLLAKPGGVLGADEAGFKLFFLPISNPIIMLFLGGFVLAAMVQKYRVDHVIVGRLLGFLGTRPYLILLGFGAATACMAMWMSNTAATALMLAVIGPVLAGLDADDRFKKALVLAIPFSASIGGIGTPVGTPPNAIAMGILAEHGIRISFLSWVLMAIPLVALMLLMTSILLYRMFPSKHPSITVRLELGEKLKGRAKGVIAIALLTILLWLTSEWHGIPESVVSLLGVALFAVFGFLSHEDMNSIHWDILILMWGGLALGQAMEISRLGEWVVALPLFDHSGFTLVAIFCVLTVLISTVISNTATANLLIPLAMSMPGENRALLAIVIALSSSFDMILPISTPPNAMAFATKVITARDLFRAGVVVMIAGAGLILLGHPFFITRILE